MLYLPYSNRNLRIIGTTRQGGKLPGNAPRTAAHKSHGLLLCAVRMGHNPMALNFTAQVLQVATSVQVIMPTASKRPLMWGSVQDILAQSLEDLRSEYATLQQHFKQASLDLLQARLVVKNIGDASSADAALVAAADAGEAATASSTVPFPAAPAAEHIASGSVTPPPRPVSEAALSAADAQSSASSYLPVGYARMLGGGSTRGPAALPATMQLSAQLANAQVKLKLERQRADAAEAQVRQLEQQLAVASGGPAAAINTPIIRDKLAGVLQVCSHVREVQACMPCQLGSAYAIPRLSALPPAVTK